MVGWCGRLEADSPRWAAPLYGLEIAIEPVIPSAQRFREIPVTPAAERDLALLLPDGVRAADLLDHVRRAAGELLEQVKVIDEYRGKGLPEGARSVAIRLTWRAPDRTLRDEEIESGLLRVRKALEQTLGVTLRTA